MDPGRGHDWGLLHSTFNNRLHDDNEEAHAFGVDDVEQIIPASVQINTLLDDRRHLYARRHKSVRLRVY